MGAVAAGTKTKGPAVGLPDGAASVGRAGGKDGRVRNFRRAGRERPPAPTRGHARSRGTEGLKASVFQARREGHRPDPLAATLALVRGKPRTKDCCCWMSSRTCSGFGMRLISSRLPPKPRTVRVP